MRASVRERFEDLEGELAALSEIVTGALEVMSEMVGRLPAAVVLEADPGDECDCGFCERAA